MNIEMNAVDSSNIQKVGYDAATRTLAVRFKSGATYHYADVAPETHASMLAASSIGGFFFANIKSKCKFEKQPEEAKE